MSGDFTKYMTMQNSHQGDNIIVVGCGVSAILLKNPERVITIGVNDIQRLFTPSYLVVVNDKVAFLPQRWEFIRNSQAKYIFTHIRGLPIPDEQKVLIQLGRYSGHDLYKTAVDYTSNSPYIAVIIASFLGAKNIGLLGVDFTPNHFFAKTGNHPLSVKVPTIVQEYRTLRTSLNQKGIGFFNLSPTSKLDLPRMDVEDFIKM